MLVLHVWDKVLMVPGSHYGQTLPSFQRCCLVSTINSQSGLRCLTLNQRKVVQGLSYYALLGHWLCTFLLQLVSGNQKSIFCVMMVLSWAVLSPNSICLIWLLMLSNILTSLGTVLCHLLLHVTLSGVFQPRGLLSGVCLWQYVLPLHVNVGFSVSGYSCLYEIIWVYSMRYVLPEGGGYIFDRVYLFIYICL